MTAPGPVTDRRVDDPLGDLFASGSVREHVVRGALGLVLVVLAVSVAATTTPWALLALLPAAVLWRGCPTCWTLGLLRTLARREAGACRVPR